MDEDVTIKEVLQMKIVIYDKPFKMWLITTIYFLKGNVYRFVLLKNKLGVEMKIRIKRYVTKGVRFLMKSQKSLTSDKN